MKRSAPAQRLAHSLLAFAIARIQTATDELRGSHYSPAQRRVIPASVAREVRENRRWLTMARKAIQPADLTKILRRQS